MDTDSTTSAAEVQPSCVAKAIWLVPAVLLHLLAWLVAFGYVYFLVPRYEARLNDYGAPVSQDTLLVISVSDLLYEVWPVAVVTVVVFVIGVDCLIVFLTQSRAVRTTLLLLFLILPIAWYVSCYVTMSHALAPLTEIPYGG